MKKLILILCLFMSTYSQAAYAPSRFRVMIGGGTLLIPPSSYRLGFGSVDIGLLNKRTVGVAQYFNFGSGYVSFGPAWVVTGSIGLFGAIGYDFKFFNLFYLKTELNTATSIDNYSYGSAMIGLGVKW
jgi:hypothetical protein